MTSVTERTLLNIPKLEMKYDWQTSYISAVLKFCIQTAVSRCCVTSVWLPALGVAQYVTAPAGTELNNEKTKYVPWGRSNLSSENEACFVITSLKILLLKILSESRKQRLVLVIGPHSKGVAMGTICWSRARRTRGDQSWKGGTGRRIITLFA